MGRIGNLALLGLALPCMLALHGCGGAQVTGRQSTAGGESTADQAYPQLQAALLAELEHRGIDPLRSGAAAPESEDNAVRDLLVEQDDPDGNGGNPPLGVTLSWTHRLVGDYDQNGVVGISDVTPLGQFFNQSVEYVEHAGGLDGSITLPKPGDTANARRAQVDGDGNGLLSLADLTPIAAHWQQRLDGYRIYRRGPRDSSYKQLPNPLSGGIPMTVSLDQGTAQGGGPLRFEFHDALTVPGWYDYIIRPYDDESGSTGPVDLGYSLPQQPASPEVDHMVHFGELPGPVSPPVFSGGKIMLVRSDNGNYSNGYEAIKADLDAIQAEYDESGYHSGIGLEVITGGYETAIWYRGGFGGPFPNPQQTVWQEAELQEMQQVLSGGRNLLLMSQNHGVRGLFVGLEPNAWQSLGYQIVNPTVDISQTFFTHMEGLPTDRGIGPGDGNGVLPVATTSVLGAFETDPDYDDGMGQNDGERFSGSGGRVPYAIRLPEGAQFCTRAWTQQITPTEGLGGMGATDGFQPGLFFSPYGGANAYVKAYVSWGAMNAPYGPMGVYPSYSVSSQGVGRYWVIGYSWAEVQLLQDPDNTGEPTHRFDMLCNVLEWLGE